MPDNPEIPRRQVVTAIGAGWLALGGSVVVGSWAAGRFMRPNQPSEMGAEIDAGPFETCSQLVDGQMREARPGSGVWIVRLQNRLVATDATCTHLGCRTAWASDDNRFRCPCHGSSFALDGTNLDGPAPRALERLALYLKDDRLTVDQRRRFRKESGDWTHPDSFVALPEGTAT